jgi:excisionase family DNA binding protein
MLREMIRAIVREEIRAVIAEAKGDEWLSTDAAADVARVAPATIRRWVREHRLGEHRAGRMVRVLRSELEALMRGGRRNANDNDKGLTPAQRAARDFG